MRRRSCSCTGRDSRAASGGRRCDASPRGTGALRWICPGTASVGGEPWSIEAARAGVIAAIEAEVPSGRAVLVGLSLGGFVAIEVADAAPDRVAGLVLAGCSGEALGVMALPFRAFARILERLPQHVIQLLNVGFFRLRYRRSIAEPIIDGGFWPAGGASAVRSLVGPPGPGAARSAVDARPDRQRGAGPGVRARWRPVGRVLSAGPKDRHPVGHAPLQPRPAANVLPACRTLRGRGCRPLLTSRTPGPAATTSRWPARVAGG